ncbi:MAG: ABC transporter permease subunit [Planctomycetota bacterium]|jgi:ABC-type transport system involved in multi-copper enzyme maturation permease subunit
MIRGLLHKTMREVWVATLLFGLGMLLFEALLGYVLGAFREELPGTVLQISFVRTIFEGLLGRELAAEFGPHMLAAVAWVHPVILAMVWAQAITFATRVPAGEVDRGTIDVLLGLPVPRWRVYVCESVVLATIGLGLVSAGTVGFLLGSQTSPPEHRIDPGRVVVAALNFYCLYLAVGGLTFLISSASDRKGRAMALAFGLVLASFLWNFLTQFWAPARETAFLSLMHYHRPAMVFQNGGWPIADMVILIVIGTTLWVLGGMVFARRDVCTV